MGRADIKLLKELCNNFKADIVDGPFGSNMKRSDYLTKGIPVLKIQNVKPFRIEPKNLDFVNEEKYKELKRHSYKKGDIVMTKLGAPLGASAIIENIDDGLIVADLVRIRAEKVNTKYLCYHLNSPITNDFINTQQKGATRPRVQIAIVRDLPIYTPPLSEQLQIVSILDKTFAAIDKAKENVKRNLQNTKELFQSELNSIFTKKGEGWVERQIQDIAKVVNGYSFDSKYFSSSNTIKSVKITNVGVREFVEESDNYLPEKYKETLKDFQVKEGNIVIALTRTIIAAGLKVAIVPNTYNGALINQRVAALIANEKIISQRFLYNYLITDGVANYVKANVNTLMQPNLSINDLKKLPIPCPTIEIQKQIVLQLDTLFTETKKLENLYQKKLEALEVLKKSILEKAFRGELITLKEVII